ncbi:MAG: hypothetical protein PHD15_00140 [Clostridia bacterium]|nr:hypothetical protein [Clostridia bacterium]MDD4386161.1 hypothetical protein [Clostridia bacterium]
MSEYRLNKSDLLVVNSSMTKGTAAVFMGINKLNSKKGIYKINGCMLGIYNEDVREKLASDVFKKVGIPSADIDLVYDEETNENSCFSNYIIDENEELISPELHAYSEDALNSVQKYIEEYCQIVRKMDGVTENKIPEIRKNLAKMLYMDCVIDHYDRKEDNMELVCDKETGKYKRTSSWYDYGVAFERGSLQKNGIFRNLKNEEVMKGLFENYFEDIEDLYKTTKEQLTPKSINSLLTQEYCTDSLSEYQIEEIKNNLNNRMKQATKMHYIENKKRQKEQEIVDKEENQLVEYCPNIFQKIIANLKEKFNQIKNNISRNNKNEDKLTNDSTVKEDKNDEFILGLKSNINVQCNIPNNKTITNPIKSNMER